MLKQNKNWLNKQKTKITTKHVFTKIMYYQKKITKKIMFVFHHTIFFSQMVQNGPNMSNTVRKGPKLVY